MTLFLKRSTKRDVKDGKDEDLTQEPEMIKAFRDTWELGIHSYLTYLRDRLLLARELLTDNGSVFVQISDENIHHVRELMDEIFGSKNFARLICLGKTGGLESALLNTVFDYILWYARDLSRIKYHPIFKEKIVGEEGATKYTKILLSDGVLRPATNEELLTGISADKGGEFCTDDNLTSQGNPIFEFIWQNKKYSSPWKTTGSGLSKLGLASRLYEAKGSLRYLRLFKDFRATSLTNNWEDVGGIQSRADPKIYVVQTATTAIQRCLLMTTDPGDLVFDPTCGSGTTAYVAEQWGRRWITCDTSRVAITLAKQRLMTALFEYYTLARPDEGVGSGFTYKTVPHVTLKSIANNPDIREGMSRQDIDATIAKYTDQETLYDQPVINKSKVRVTGPFTVEAVPAPIVQPLTDVTQEQPADDSIARSGETLRQTEWRDELFRTGIRGKGGQTIAFSRVELLPGTRWLHAEAETKGDPPQRVVISFGPEHAPLEQRQVERAVEEAQRLVPKPNIIVFAAFQFDPEAAKDIDETVWTGVTLLKAQINADLLTEDLKKKRSSNESFWLIGQPDVHVERLRDGPHKGTYQVIVQGFDYYNTKSGIIESGGTANIALWMLDTDYDGRSLFPRQVFFPMAGATDGWMKVAKNLKAEIDEDRIASYRGTISLPFVPGSHRRIAVKIVDDRGIESLKIIEVA
jgi:adenine-specific DNA-methyltransferase